LRLVCVTYGADGCEAFWRDGSRAAPGFRVAAVDTTGAGDGWVAGLLACMAERPGELDLDEARLEAALRFANAVGALTCTVKGAIPALPDRAAVQRFLHETTAH